MCGCQYARELSDAAALMSAMLGILIIGIVIDSLRLRPPRAGHPPPLGPERQPLDAGTEIPSRPPGSGTY